MIEIGLEPRGGRLEQFIRHIDRELVK